MFDGSIRSNDDDTWVPEAKPRNWKEVDHALRELARCRSALDADEARLLCIAARDEIWRQLGRGSFYEYLEEVLGHSPRNARERVRVAKALAELPALEIALANGELHWSAVRELTRVATPATVDKWLAVARGKNLRRIEEAVAGRIKGDEPDDPPKRDRLTRRVTMELRLDTIALIGRVRERFSDERGEVPDEDMLIAALCNAYLDGDGSTADDGRAKFQLMVVACPSCDHAAHESAGRRYPIDSADRARVECDVQRVGSDAAPGRATQDVTPKTRRFVRRRDGGRCCVPGCRASRYLEIHHIVPREAGGSHDAENLTLTCDAHHRAVHEGKLVIAGKAPMIEVRWLQTGAQPTHVGRDAVADVNDEHTANNPVIAATEHGDERSVSATFGSVIAESIAANERSSVGSGCAASDELRSVVASSCTAEHMKLAADALSVLVSDLRFPKHIARTAIDAAFEELGPAPALERLIFIAVRSCSNSSNG